MYNLPKEVQEILDKFKTAGYEIYIVGGAVRDLLMKKDIHDWDFTTDAKPEEVLKIFPEGFYNNKFGTVGIPVKNTSEVDVYEITTMRKEGLYTDFRHPKDISWTNKIEEDLSRRDFTVNAMALDSKGNIIDPFNGQEDLQKKLIRAVGDPNKRFQEDALRLIRAIRFATQLNFKIEEVTKNAIAQNVALIKNIAFERIKDELFKILELENSYQGIILLREVGLLQLILLELEKCFGIIQVGPKHARVYDIGEHSLLTLKNTPSPDPLVRLAALLHDVGKPDTAQTQGDGNVTFYGHDVVGGKIVLKIAKRFNLSKAQTEKLYRLVRWHMFTVSEHQTDSAIRRFIKNVGLKNIDNMMALRIGDRLGGGTQRETSWRMEKFKERIKQVLIKPFSISDLKVNGNDVMKELGIKPGPKVGEILQKLFEEVLEDASKNNREYLLNRIKQFAQ
ncbi:MAG: HD domain-containing protein [Candidatus Daviesbacteria bacterium]|nr:MAG: HD domain-containing protein [Candidatus Daviesbacteria bacterium]